MTPWEKYRQVVREAVGTGWALLALILFWCTAGFGLAHVPVTFAHVPVTFAHVPLWVWAAIGGTWFLAVFLVKFLTAKVFRDMALDEEADHDGR